MGRKDEQYMWTLSGQKKERAKRARVCPSGWRPTIKGEERVGRVGGHVGWSLAEDSKGLKTREARGKKEIEGHRAQY